MIFLLLGEEGCFPNPQKTHHTTQFSSASAPTRPQLSSARSFLPSHWQLSSADPSYHVPSYPLRGTSIHYPDSSPLSVFPFHFTYRFSRPRILDQHHTSTPNLSFPLCTLKGTIHGAPISLVVGSIHGTPIFIHHNWCLH